MATPDEKHSPINETSPSKDNNNYTEEDIPGCASCLFQHLCFKTWESRQNNSYRHLAQPERSSSQTRETWVSRNLKKAKEFSEVLAGPKWKNFIRRFRANGVFTKNDGGGKKRRTQFQYDIHSYALNFDDGVDQEGGGGGHFDFASGYACRISIDIDQDK